MNIKFLLLLGVLFLFVLPLPAYAYLDPSTGSYLLQIMAAAFFGGAYAVATWWRQIKTFFSRILRKDKKTSEKHSPKAK